MIEIIKNPKEVKTDPHYILEYKYMIGDANGDTHEQLTVSVDNPYIERYYCLLNSFEPRPGRIGVILDREYINNSLKEGNITSDDYEFLIRLMFESVSEFNVPEENNDHSYEFCEGVRSENEYSKLFFKGVSLSYVSDNGAVYGTKVTYENK